MATARDVINSTKPKTVKIPKGYKTPVGQIGYDNIRDDIEKTKSLREGEVVKVPANDYDIANKKYVDDEVAGAGGGVSDHSALNELDYASAAHTGFEPAKGADDNFVTDAEKIVIGNTSGTNTGDNTTHADGDGSDHADVATNTAASHAQAHTVASHSDTTGTGAELNTLTDNSMADTLHRHSELSASDGTPDRALVVDAAGKVGIGTTSPDVNLHLYGTDESETLEIINTESSANRYPGFGVVNYAGATAGHPFAYFHNAAGTKASPTVLTAGKSAGIFVFRAYDGTSFKDIARFGARIGPNFGAGDQEGQLYFMTGDGASYSTRMVIEPNGNVGIGTATPGEMLDVVGNAEINGNIIVTGTVDGVDIAARDHAEAHSIVSHNDTTGTGAELDELTDGSETALHSHAGGAGGDFSDGGEAGGADRTLGNTDNYDLGFLTNNTNRLHIQNDGAIGIGTTAPAAEAKVHIKDDVNDVMMRVETAKVNGMAFFDIKNDAQQFSFGVMGLVNDNFGIFDVTNIKFPLMVEPATPTSTLVLKGTTGNVGVGTATPSEKLDVNSDAIRIRTAQTPASAGAAGTTGQICWDASYIYVCVATNTWKRSAISTW